MTLVVYSFDALIMASPKRLNPVLNIIRPIVPIVIHSHIGLPSHFQNPASMEMDKPIPINARLAPGRNNFLYLLILFIIYFFVSLNKVFWGIYTKQSLLNKSNINFKTFL